MECKFVVGQKVVCVDAATGLNLDGLKEGVTYTVRGLYYVKKHYVTFNPRRNCNQHWNEGVSIILEELRRDPDHYGWLARRFKPLHEADISIFEKMCEKGPTENIIEALKSDLDDLCEELEEELEEFDDI